MLDDSKRQELIARLEDLHNPSTEDATEPAESTEFEAQDDRNESESAPAEAQAVDDDAQDAGQERQSGAQRRISELVRQRNAANQEFRQLQEQHAELQRRLEEMNKGVQEPEPQQMQQYYDEYGNPVEQQLSNPQLDDLRAEFDSYRENQMIEQVKNQLESEIEDALQQHSHIDSQWLRKQLIDAVRLDGNADIAETAEYYSAFVRELQQAAAPAPQQVPQNRTPREAPPRLSGRSTASAGNSQQGDKPFTREDARRRAYEAILNR